VSTNNPTPRLTEGTRVRYTAREDTPDNYGINGVTGVVTKDDGNDVVPYIVRLDSQVTVSGFGTRFATDHIAADGIELEILP
jgi:3D (Asp-Asp-Asp) domain-containing protein